MIRTNFPKIKFIEVNDLREQLDHVFSEVEEIRNAYFDPEQGMVRVLEELADLHHSLETFWYIAEKEFGSKVIGSIFTSTIVKNRARGYYELPNEMQKAGCLCGGMPIDEPESL